MEGRSGSLLSGGDAHSVWLRNLANIVISRGIFSGVLHMLKVESEQVLLSPTAVYCLPRDPAAHQ